MELELKHLAPYLPYGLKVQDVDEPKETFELTGLCLYSGDLNYQLRLSGGQLGLFDLDEYTPILRPLSDLTGLLSFDNYNNGKKCTPLLDLAAFNCDLTPEQETRLYMKTEDNGKLFEVWYNTGGEDDDCLFSLHKDSIESLPYRFVRQLIEWHFDVFGLIDKGLAIDINTLDA